MVGVSLKGWVLLLRLLVLLNSQFDSIDTDFKVRRQNMGLIPYFAASNYEKGFLT